jgi:hypothetical protein
VLDLVASLKQGQLEAAAEGSERAAQGKADAQQGGIKGRRRRRRPCRQLAHQAAADERSPFLGNGQPTSDRS